MATISFWQIFECYASRNMRCRIAVLLIVNGQAIAALVTGNVSIYCHLFTDFSDIFFFFLWVKLSEIKFTQFDQQRRNHFLLYIPRISMMYNVVRVEVLCI